jgi:Flavodoxin-like fold
LPECPKENSIDFLAKIIREELEQNGHEVRLTEIKNGYDIGEEVEKHLWADVIITQSPVYWFGNPWIYKKYIDEVFNAGLLQQKMVANDGRTSSDPTKQYGTGGLMQGKKRVWQRFVRKGITTGLNPIFTSTFRKWIFKGDEPFFYPHPDPLQGLE